MLENKILSSLIEIFSEYDCESKIKEVFHYYKDYNENFIMQLLTEERKMYSEERSLGLARLFEDAGTPIKADELIAYRQKGIHIYPKSFRFLPLLFYRRAADRNSMLGCEQTYWYYNHGSSDFVKDEIVSKYYIDKALKLGSINPYINSYNLSLEELEKIPHNNRYVGLFYYWFRKNNGIKAKEYLYKIKNDLSEDTQQKVIKALEEPLLFSQKKEDKYYDAAKFLRGETNEFNIVSKSEKKSFFQRLFGR